MPAFFGMQPCRIYEEGLKTTRAAFRGHPVIRELLSPRADPKTVELFLIYFHIVNAGMAEIVSAYLEKAADACAALGLEQAGDRLRHHAVEGRSHHRWAAADALLLAEHWNRHYRNPRLDPERLLAIRAATSGVIRYRELHESAAAGPAPYSVLAIAAEIEGLALRFGPRMVCQCVLKFGPKVLGALSFVELHILSDRRHYAADLGQIHRLLSEHPAFAEPLIRTGAAALLTYGACLEDCRRYTQNTFVAPW
jgi:hypothetical protein